MLLKRSQRRTNIGLISVITGILVLCFLTFAPRRSSDGVIGPNDKKKSGDVLSDDHAVYGAYSDSIYAQDFEEDEVKKNPVASGVQEDASKTTANSTTAPIDDMKDEDDEYNPISDGIDYRELFSLSTTNRQFSSIFTGGIGIYNPNIIPHPTDHNLWIMIAQHEQSGHDISVSEEVTCNVGLLDGTMVCTAEPTVLPIEPSIVGNCTADFAYFNYRSGPRDARMYYGPDAPYIMYGSQSSYSCIGIWMEDARMLLEDFNAEKSVVPKLFTHATEVQRPPPVRGMEKNFFLFWDGENKAYVHHDIFPHRVFAQLSFDGSVGSDLAVNSASKDDVCLTMYMPPLTPTDESIHQATNSLSITLCYRADPGCVPDDSNTFIFTIFHHKSYHDFHGVYEPYVMTFQRNAPFAIHGVSQRPLWIHGRAALTKDTHSLLYENDPGREIPGGHTEMFYVTSISWKTHGQKYHGYLDDPLFLAFGIEDTRAGLIDVLAEELFQDLGFCPWVQH
ncbi:hypothetical protein D6C91_09689 [Aureobasidium pullulans]|uniref:Uncharacterized protein n=1 Tax=Aureobasidium pullulans TaxID=5580 RepID=A0A4S9SIH0_AURPU|nr:hypothetical protein D6C91_09689 [Aureobasidium pullulans]